MNNFQFRHGEVVMQMFFIWNHERGLWRRPAGINGFTENLSEAGTYITKKAVDICAVANRFKYSERMIPISLIDNIRSDRVRKESQDFEEYRKHNLKIKNNKQGFFMRIENQCIQIEETKKYLELLMDSDIDTSSKYIAQQAMEKLKECEFKLEKKIIM